MNEVQSWQAIGTIVTLSLFVEGVVEYFTPAFPPGWKWLKMYVAATIAILVALAYNADLPAAMGLPAVPYVGPILTGLVLGRGSNFLAVFYKKQQVIEAPAQTVESVPGMHGEPAVAVPTRTAGS